MEQRVTDLDGRLTALAPMITTVAQLSVHVETLRADFRDFRERINERDEETRKDRRNTTRWAITLTVTIIAALIGAIAVIATAGGHP